MRACAVPHEHVPAGWQAERHRPDALRKNDFSSLTNPLFMELLVSHPFIGHAAGLLMQAEGVRLWHDQLLYKPGASQASGDTDAQPVVGWHTDQSYWKSCTGPMITAWVPFTDCPIEMGPISMLDGSNHWPLSNRDQSDFFGSDLQGQLAQFDSGGADMKITPMEMKAGQISFHCWQTIHGSSPNRLAQPRRSMAIHLQSTANEWQQVISQRTGKVVTHEIDQLVSRDPSGNPNYRDPDICPVLWSQETGHAP